ncbi:hypothetical protein MYCTH_2119965 [Thermothelomyces thermophilus ATCC 42464]|uniref:Uncharacterized protein n=1 Tax=Thermothelomyces thermophilus (strain ATCC 42464 / BCRC 31852 / DSM 1799) TaxID=573729 RepID=G2QJW3_THET4|nr:uncharacterized protein MYCTH_2119965 [Thermothelomyces thermophilus ATCC 42464]AEO59869.1 hypothetical protein MYCTH_2119965 [Thermothelomyces thermophilus ATCC 42464]
MEEIRRAALEQEQLFRVLQISEKLELINTPFLDQEHLDYLGVAVRQPLDVDDDGTRDFDPRFFESWLPDELVAEVACDELWMDRLGPDMSPAEWRFEDYKFRWFQHCLEQLYEMDNEIWDPWFTDALEIRQCTGLALPFRQRLMPEEYYLPVAAFFPVDKTKPHVACVMADSNVAPGDQVLYSEVHSAVRLVRFRLEQGQHTGHHTKPGMLYTLHRDLFARITQVHFDGKSSKLVLRRSRRLDLRGPEPPKDAYLLVRWVANRPVGQTEYVDEPEPDEWTTTKDSSNTAPRILLGYAS